MGGGLHNDVRGLLGRGYVLGGRTVDQLALGVDKYREWAGGYGLVVGVGWVCEVVPL